MTIHHSGKFASNVQEYIVNNDLDDQKCWNHMSHSRQDKSSIKKSEYFSPFRCSSNGDIYLAYSADYYEAVNGCYAYLCLLN